MIARLDPDPEGPAPGAMAESEVWSLLGRGDVVLRGVLEAQGREQRRVWEERARAWLREINQAWIRSPR